nr:putative neutral sphingomyelinase [Onthophagus taurus]
MDFKIFSLNCWGIPIISKDRNARFKAISEALSTSAYDVVCLQEVWAESDFILIKEKVETSLRYSHYFYSGVIGSGICVFSKYPILDVFFHQWTVNGYVHKIQHADWFGGKGIGFCKLLVDGFNINIYSAHLHAEYNRLNDEYQCHRVQQAYDTAQFIQQTSGLADLIVLAGDLNTEPEDLAYRIIVHLTGLKDSFLEVKEDSKEIHKIGTNESFYNSYADKKAIRSGDAGKRIDYIMYGCPKNPNIKITTKKYCQPLPRRVPEKSFSYSDHEAITATLQIEKGLDEIEELDRDTCTAILEECILISNTALRNLRTKRFGYWILTCLLFLILVSSTPFNAPDGYNYLVHFGRLLVTLLMAYLFFMGSLWYKMEFHGILAGKLAMEVGLNRFKDNRMKNF